MPKFEVMLLERVSYLLVVEAENFDVAGPVAEDLFVQVDITRLSSTVLQRTVDHVVMADADAELTTTKTADNLQGELVAALEKCTSLLIAQHGEPPLYRNPEDAARRPFTHSAWRTIDAGRAAILKAGGTP